MQFDISHWGMNPQQSVLTTLIDIALSFEKDKREMPDKVLLSPRQYHALEKSLNTPAQVLVNTVHTDYGSLKIGIAE